MKRLLAVAVLLVVVCEETEATDVPKPWLMLDRTAKVLHVQCKPPEEASGWRAVHDLRLSAFLNHYSVSHNVSLVNMTSNMKEPKVNDMFSIFNVTFQGRWLSKSVSLDYLFPVTSKELGRYFCIVKYSDQNNKHSSFSTEVTVDKSFISSHIATPSVNINNFKVSVIDAHEVKVTWTKPENTQFAEASVSRLQVDDRGNAVAPSTTLFSTNGIRHLVYNSDVLLTKFNPNDNGNLSMTMYVKREWHSSSYRYSCRVPYPACTGQKAAFCTCCQQDNNPDRQLCSPSPQDSHSFLVPFIICFVLLLLFVAVVLTVYCLFKRGRCRQSRCLQKFFTPKREATTKRGTEGPPPPTDSRPDSGTRPEDSREPLLEDTSNPSLSCPAGVGEHDEDGAAGSRAEEDMESDRTERPKGKTGREASLPEKRAPSSGPRDRQGESRFPGTQSPADMTRSLRKNGSGKSRAGETVTSKPTQPPTPADSREREEIEQSNTNPPPTDASSVRTGSDQSLDESSLGAVGGSMVDGRIEPPLPYPTSDSGNSFSPDTALLGGCKDGSHRRPLLGGHQDNAPCEDPDKSNDRRRSLSAEL